MEAEKADHGRGGQAVKAQGKIVLATVKGDVHDIGKNIVGVVLALQQLRGDRPRRDGALREDPGDAPRRRRRDVIGLSGLITPSLDEMVHVAREMERQGFKLPLLIGGATTSKAHTAVKIAPHYSQPVVHVLDASRAVPVTTSLLSATTARPPSWRNTARSTTSCDNFTPRRNFKLVSLETARAKRTPIDWTHRGHRPRPSSRACACSTIFRSRTSRDFIDWTPFFRTWELNGRYPRILEDEKYGEQARQLFAEANALLDTIIEKKLITARGVYGFFPANAVGDDVELYTDESRSEGARTLSLPPPAAAEGISDDPYRCFADFIAPQDTGLPDYIGALRRDERHRARRSSASSSRPSTTTTTRSWPRRSPTASPRRSPSACTSACAKSGATAAPRT